MGRKPLDPVHMDELLNFAKRKGFDGFSRADAINEGAVAENRWALLRDRTMKQGMLIKRGWKKSARYFHFEYSEKPEELPFLTEEVSDEEVDDEADDAFEELDAPFPVMPQKAPETVFEVVEEEPEIEQVVIICRHCGATSDLPVCLCDDEEDIDEEDELSDDIEELNAIIESLQEEPTQSDEDDTGWDFDF